MHVLFVLVDFADAEAPAARRAKSDELEFRRCSS
jgi:hypothetical protein